MGLTSGTFLAAVIVAAIVLCAGVVVSWNRMPRVRTLRWLLRGGLLVTTQVAVCAMLLTYVNDTNRFFSSWSALAGRQARVTANKPLDGALDAGLRRLHHRHQSAVVPVQIPVAGSDRVIPAQVYVPAAYFDPRNATSQFSVVELLDGFPGGPDSWLHSHLMNLRHTLDTEFRSGRAQPFLAVMPTQNFQGTHDGECIDAAGGVQVESTLVRNVRQVVEAGFRVRHSPDSWSVMGYSTGGYCALNIAMRHPDLFGSAVSLEGYTSPYVDSTTGPIFGHGTAYRHANDPAWRLEHGPVPALSLLLAYCGNDPAPARDAVAFARHRRDPLQVSLLRTPGGGHNFATFRVQQPAAFDWIARRILPPLAPAAGVNGHRPLDVGPSTAQQR